MATITSAGIGSGLNVSELVGQLVAAERAPADNRLNTIETSTKAQISAFGSIKAALAGIESSLKKLDGAGGLPGRKATVATDAGFTASAGTSAALGSYSVIVEKLATAHKLQSAAATSTTQIGDGTLTLKVGDGDAFDVTIDAGKGTLADIRDAINSQAAGKGVSATLVNGDSGQVLVLSSGKTGAAGALTVSASGGDGGLSVLATTGGTLTEVAAAQDAVVHVDGITRTSSTNTLTDLVDGITLTLTKAKPGEAFSLDVDSDASTLKASMLGFISAYNTALGALRTQSAAGGEGKLAGPLSGDSAPRAITASLRNAIGNNYAELNALGLKTAVDGSLSLDGSKFDAAIAANPSAIKSLLGEDANLGKSVRDMLHNYVGAQGLLADRSKSLDTRMKTVSQQRADLDARMERLEASYRRQFTALDAMMAQMQSTSSYIAQQLGALNSR
ncbi:MULTISPECIES: flagellar filament capping protein FliD [Thermomonas]|jgi:flagellar hook-associated protein 2|uniref:Flagellar hook-associated protein 2 n=1 Tax=Thermomonas fusca TaxID=215690 RepID=A0A5R9PD44_9GAMM|nr:MULTISPECIES: flagellar filament capping protein FliD [Thermomonas]TLX21414.1 flagellar protein [Thermomonas fusca]